MKKWCLAILEETYPVLSTGVLLMLAGELFKPRLVLAYTNLNFWLVLWLLNAIILMVLKANHKPLTK